MTDAASARKPEAVPIPSATVMVVRDSADGIEVFMLVRNRQIDFASGALVFPGGKVDAQDRDAIWQQRATISATNPDRSYWVSALRETFEETGLLLANAASGQPVGLADAQRITRTTQTAVAEGRQTFADVLADQDLSLATNRLIPFAHWITPLGMPKRFDTHFFLAEVPEGQIPVHDGGEAVESLWIKPLQAVEDAEAGRRTLVPATTLNLEMLAETRTVAEAFTAARARHIVPVMPTVTPGRGGVTITIPADAGYNTTSVFLPRPNPA